MFAPTSTPRRCVGERMPCRLPAPEAALRRSGARSRWRYHRPMGQAAPQQTAAPPATKFESPAVPREEFDTEFCIFKHKRTQRTADCTVIHSACVWSRREVGTRFTALAATSGTRSITACPVGWYVLRNLSAARPAGREAENSTECFSAILPKARTTN